MTSDPVAGFAAVAERYVTWAEGPNAGTPADVRHAVVLLLDLLRVALELPARTPGDRDPIHRTHAEWQAIHKTFSWLPVQYYWTTDPLTEGPEQLMTGDLCDDLADILCDLKPPLILYREGEIDTACWHWKFGFEPTGASTPPTR